LDVSLRRVRFPPDTRWPCGNVAEMAFEADRFWQAIESRDPRFDGWFFCGVRTTGIYGRPSCPARTPKRENVRLFATAAAAQAAGYRACMRCRPDATPGSPELDRRSDLVGRAMRLIADGVVDREGVVGLAHRLGYGQRHLQRELVAVLGAGPLALAHARWAQTARVLLEATELPIVEVAFAAGFGSVRQFNETVQHVFALGPSELRSRARKFDLGSGTAEISLRLPYRAPIDARSLIAFLGMRAVPGVEEVLDGVYRRSLRLPHGVGVVECLQQDRHVCARYRSRTCATSRPRRRLQARRLGRRLRARRLGRRLRARRLGRRLRARRLGRRLRARQWARP
jgi:AraC family transcriptional regulator, regulatory protein of adaptative response / DNA-3-methyladenine glycosylase II